MAVKDQVVTNRYAIYNGDCMDVMALMPEASIDMSIYSPPFAGLYNYSSSDRDLSNCKDYSDFFTHYDFIGAEVARLTKPGRMTCVHCMDVPSGNTGLDYLTDFPGDIVRMHVRCRKANCNATESEKTRGACGHGWWRFVARYAVWKEPLTVRNRTLTKALAHKSIVEDSSRCTVASADYMLVFRRAGTNTVPIAHPQGLISYAGERKIPAELLRYRNWSGKQTQNRYSHWIWRQYASAFWDDVRLDRVLPFKPARESDDEKHVHPLQLDVIERALILWSNPGEKILTPFLGVGSEVCGAIANERLGIGIELKPSYFKQAIRNCAHVAEHGLGEGYEQASVLDGLMDEDEEEETQCISR